MSANETGETRPPATNGRNLSQRRLLQSIVEVARSVFGAAAASVFLIDPDSGELVFEAVCGEGEEHLVGMRFPGDTGIAGWVASSGQPLLVDDVTQNPQFAAGAARHLFAHQIVEMIAKLAHRAADMAGRDARVQQAFGQALELAVKARLRHGLFLLWRDGRRR